MEIERNIAWRGIRLMQRKYSFLFGTLFKLPYVTLPAVIVSVVGGMLFTHYAHLSETTRQIAIGTSAGTEMMQMVRDEHELIVNYLQKYTEARQRTDLAAEEEMVRSRAAEQTAMLAASEAKAAQTRALAIAANVTTKPERKVASKQPAEVLDKVAIREPLQLVHLASATTQIQAVTQHIPPPAGRAVQRSLLNLMENMDLRPPSAAA
jgi:hypothetical protein